MIILLFALLTLLMATTIYVLKSESATKLLKDALSIQYVEKQKVIEDRDRLADVAKIAERSKLESERDLQALRRTIQPLQEERQKLASEVEPLRIRANELSEETRRLRQELAEKVLIIQKLIDKTQKERAGRVDLEQARVDLQALMEEARRKQEESLQEWEKLQLRCSRNGFVQLEDEEATDTLARIEHQETLAKLR